MMNGEQDKILSMLEEGTISAEEAQELLAAVEGPEDDAGPEFEVARATDAPDMSRFRDAWRVPFTISLAALALSGAGLLRARRGWRLLLAPVTLLAAVATVISYLSKDAPWLHVRVRSADGDRVNVSLPLPLPLLRAGLAIARQNAVNDEARQQLDMAEEFLAAMDQGQTPDPLVIDVNDEGDSVQVYLG